MAQLIACVRWRSNTTGLHYCEYFDKRTGDFLCVGMAQTRNDAEIRAARKLPTAVRKAFPHLGNLIPA